MHTLILKSGLHDREWRKFIFKWLLISLGLHLIAAYFSSGFFHADEHFQIVEFANYKLGQSPASELPLEYRHLMRPWLFPAILTKLTEALMSAGIQNPFQLAFSYRLLSGLIGWLSTVALTLACYSWFKELHWRSVAVKSLSLLWFIPALHARHSSENLGGSVFFIGLSLLSLALRPHETKNDETKTSFNSLPHWAGFIVGLLFGFAFEFRYQVGFLVAGSLLWLLLIARIPARSFVALGAGLLISIGIGTALDNWGYGQWSFAPWNYLNFNLIQNHVSDTDTSPWWDYFRKSMTEAWPLLGSLVLLSFIVAWTTHPLHLLTWSIVPFFLMHTVIGHKEWRFLFPMAHMGGIAVAQALAGLQQRLSKFSQPSDATRKSIRLLGKFFIYWNLLALFLTTMIPPSSTIRFYEDLYRFREARPIAQLEIWAQTDVLMNAGGASMNFYRPRATRLIYFKNYQELSQRLRIQNAPTWLFSPSSILPDHAKELQTICQVEFSALPVWLEKLGLKQLNEGRISNWTLFRCQNSSY